MKAWTCPDVLVWAETRIVLYVEHWSLFCLVVFDWEITSHRQERSSLYLWRNSLFPSDRHHDNSVINVTPFCVCVSRVISAHQRVRGVCSSNNGRLCVYMCVCVAACVCSYCVITKIIKLWSLRCCCHGLKCFRKYELLFLSRAKHPIWGGLTNNSWLVQKEQRRMKRKWGKRHFHLRGHAVDWSKLTWRFNRSS